MAEVKNSFLSSKMNKDLDDRLIPNDQYRDALNISVGKSEQDQIGTVQNSLGNTPVIGSTENGLTCIGFYMDDQNNRIYRFLTNYKDKNPTAIIPCEDPINDPDIPIGGWKMKITVYDFNVPGETVLVEGTFLNFSTTNLITGVNLLEGLLFFTDNRNQPRKINYSNAINNPANSLNPYYTTETQISVAKYAPVEAPILFREVNTIASSVDGLDITVEDVTGITVGMTLLVKNTVNSCEYSTVLSIDGNVVSMYSLPSSPIIQPGDDLKFLISTMSDESNNQDWPGDPAYLESKYVRFSYRFKFDDNEYSIIAPFSQIAYIPKQKGYFINGNEDAAYRSTILKWMENNINNIDLLITLPDVGNNIRNSYKITSVDILYKESDGLTIKVLDTVSSSTISNSIGANTNIYNYKYQSQKPYKTLSEDQITRVYDKVPTRALTQELSGNRVIYGNFYTTYNAPKYIDYKVGAQPKDDAFTNFIEYPNHTLKQNRNYQVGFVLADKFGRQSSVILSTVDLATQEGFSTFGSSTIYSPYKKENDPLFPEVRCWKGNALRVLVNNVIDSDRNIPAGTPGLYAKTQGNGFAISNATISNKRLIYTFDINSSPIPNPDYPNDIPFIGQYLRGKYNDYTEITNVEWTIYPTPSSPPLTTNNRDDFPNPPFGSYEITTKEEISDLYLHNDVDLDVKYAYELNQIGWYSYKVVVKQREQDYYNVYLPGILDGYPVNQTSGSQVIYTDITGIPSLQNGINQTSFPVNENNKTSHMVLINDNINKVPRDLVEVGPDQKQYRSSVELYGRVQNYPNKIPLTIEPLSLSDYYAESVTYDPSADPYNLLDIIKPGDGFQCVIPNAPSNITLPKWHGNTVVTSIENWTSLIVTKVSNASGLTTIQIPKYCDIKAADNISYNIAGTPYTGVVVHYDPPTGDLELTLPTLVTIPANTRIDITRPHVAIIRFTPSNPILGLDSISSGQYAYTDFTFTTAENFQYYPLRKADIVNTIAYATDFNFLSNTVNNITGTAGLNFYQLQSNPLIGRVSTSKKMGTISSDMIPMLGVYETAPTESLLDLFWETSTTGLISDLNWAVLTDFNGAVGTTNPFFDFWEYQNYLGTNNNTNDDSNTGDPDSPFISRKFFIVDNVNNSINPTTCNLYSVYDLNNNNVTNRFELVTIPGTIKSYRLKIKDYFVFNHDADTSSNFKFTLKVVYSDIATDLTLSTRLKNIEPEFLISQTQYTVTLSTDDIVQVTATNGAFRSPPPSPPAIGNPVTSDLYWHIIDGNDDNYFSIDSATGQLKLIDHLAQLGVYFLTIQIDDAAWFGTTPPSLLINSNLDLSSKSNTIELMIIIGEDPVNPFLEYYEQGFEMPDFNNEFPDQITTGFFGVYVGTEINTNAPGVIPTLPFPNDIINVVINPVPNVQFENGAYGGLYPSPTGLTKGALRFRWTQYGETILHAVTSKTFLLIYHRPDASSSWTLIKDDNYSGSISSPWWGNGFSTSDPNCFRVSSVFNNASTGSIKVSEPGEYFFALKTQTPGLPGPTIVVEDANYYYERTYPHGSEPPYGYINPFIPRERFMVGLTDLIGSASGVSYNSFSEEKKFDWTITSTILSLDSVTPLTKFIINGGTSVNDSNVKQIIPGIWVTKNSGSEFSNNVRVAGFSASVNEFGAPIYEVTINTTFATPPAIGDTLTFRQLQKTDAYHVKPLGNIWASVKDFTYTKQFYNEGALTSRWQVPSDSKFYNVKPTPLANPILPAAIKTSIPNNDVANWGSAQINDNGSVIQQETQPSVSAKDTYYASTASLAIIKRNSNSIIEKVWPIITPDSITSTSVRLEQIPEVIVIGGTNLITWSTECTTPTELYYPDQTVEGPFEDDIYTITGLTPDTIYYILVYAMDAEGYVGGNYHPISIRTLPA